jgi:hypothetical protein
LKNSKFLLIATQVCLLMAGCGGGKNPADGVGLAVLPTKVIIGPGPIRSCADLQQSPLPAASVQGPLMFFPKLRIDWTSQTHALLISTIRVTVTGRGIKDGSYTYMVSAEELGSLLGGPDLMPNTFVDISHRTETDPRGKSRNLNPCTFLVPGIALTNGNATPSFQARVRIEVIGSALNADYTDQYFVRQFITNKADYIKY